ncbi:chorion transcription factor Cf2 isoform X2 [Drosophila sulfurigaster albostrigata]|uniref:chorion transcription factor Cf2 isoform X2 n=1 Tax=Drosophila sulfurigaster albostrigata TaxID=89887 RepID=UPI002D21955E|nr:chorion transcription factor Cf2 isoform X2 [Drosophila sulfurigaster albostrigata]
MLKSSLNTQELRLPRPEEHQHQQHQQQHLQQQEQPTHQVAAVIAHNTTSNNSTAASERTTAAAPATGTATATGTAAAASSLNMDTLKTAFLPNLSMDQNVISHYCPMCHQQFERAQHAADHMQLCHGISLQTHETITTLEQQQQQQHQQQQQQQLKSLSYPCANCDDKFGSALEVDEHHRLTHQATAFLARCMVCSIYGVNSITQNPNEYKCTHCGAVCTAAMLAAGQQTFMEHQEAPVTPDDLPAIAPRDMRLTPEEQQHQQQQQLQQEQQLQQQQQQQQQEQHHHQQLEQQQQQEQQQRQRELQEQQHQDDLSNPGTQKVPPLTVKLLKNGNGATVTHPQVIIKEEPLSLSDSGDVVNAVPVYAIQANPVGQQQSGAAAGATSSVLVSTQTVPADLAHKIRHKCPDCPKTFKTPGTLAMHRKIHTGEADATPKERPYTCSYCGKSFTQSNTLKQHTRIHTGEKPFRCGYCGRAFTVKDYLNKHLTTHTGEKPFHCGYCEKSFSVKDYLTKHIRTHTGEKPYTCPYCDKRFTQRSALTVHTTKLHPL